MNAGDKTERLLSISLAIIPYNQIVTTTTNILGEFKKKYRSEKNSVSVFLRFFSDSGSGSDSSSSSSSDSDSTSDSSSSSSSDSDDSDDEENQQPSNVKPKGKVTFASIAPEQVKPVSNSTKTSQEQEKPKSSRKKRTPLLDPNRKITINLPKAPDTTKTPRMNDSLLRKGGAEDSPANPKNKIDSVSSLAIC